MSEIEAYVWHTSSDDILQFMVKPLKRSLYDTINIAYLLFTLKYNLRESWKLLCLYTQVLSSHVAYKRHIQKIRRFINCIVM